MLIIITAALGGFLFGYDTAVISGTISLVKAKYGLDTVMEGWYVSSALVGCILGVAFAGELSDRFGRKKSLMLSGLMFSISAIGCALCQTHVQLIVYRFIGGAGIGIASMLSPLYISEIAPARTRGTLVTLYQFAITLGILFSFFVNAWLLRLSANDEVVLTGPWQFILKEEVWRGMLGSETVPAVLFFLAVFLIPESPRWYVSQGKSAEAGVLLTRMNGPNMAREELSAIEASVAREKGSTWQALFQGRTRLLLIAGVGLAILSQFTGVNAIIYYGPRIMEQAGVQLGDALGGQVIIGIVNATATLFAIWKWTSMAARRSCGVAWR
jgi:sugar porter (SP) family MFS transporter